MIKLDCVIVYPGKILYYAKKNTSWPYEVPAWEYIAKKQFLWGRWHSEQIRLCDKSNIDTTIFWPFVSKSSLYMHKIIDLTYNQISRYL